jgi:hypothetical protein
MLAPDNGRWGRTMGLRGKKNGTGWRTGGELNFRKRSDKFRRMFRQGWGKQEKADERQPTTRRTDEE